MFKAIVISVLSGAVATTTAEYVLKYNLLDFLIDKVKWLFSKEYRAIKSKL